MRISVVTFVTLLLTLPLSAQSSNLADLLNAPSNQVWMSKDVRWEKAPRDVNPKLASGSATILYFGPDGKFKLIKCILYRTPEYLAMSVGDARVVSVGTWTLRGQGIFARHTVIYRTVVRVPPLPEAEKSALITLSQSELVMDNGRFVPIGNRIHPSDVEEY